MSTEAESNPRNKVRRRSAWAGPLALVLLF